VPPKVSVSGLSIAFGPTRALDRVSLAVNDGEFVSIVGPSGCGKSTMLNVIAGLLPPLEGGTRVAGIEGNGAGSRIGYMFQKDTLLAWATALENVCLPMDVKGARVGHVRHDGHLHGADRPGAPRHRHLQPHGPAREASAPLAGRDRIHLS